MFFLFLFLFIYFLFFIFYFLFFYFSPLFPSFSCFLFCFLFIIIIAIIMGGARGLLLELSAQCIFHGDFGGKKQRGVFCLIEKMHLLVFRFFHHVFGCFVLCLFVHALGSVGLLCLVCLSGRLICMITVRCLWHGTNVTRLRIYGCSTLWLPVCIRFVLHIQVSDDDDDGAAAGEVLWTWYMDRSMDVAICRAIAGDYIHNCRGYIPIYFRWGRGGGGVTWIYITGAVDRGGWYMRNLCSWIAGVCIWYRAAIQHRRPANSWAFARVTYRHSSRCIRPNMCRAAGPWTKQYIFLSRIRAQT